MTISIHINRKQEDFLRSLSGQLIMDCEQRKAYNEIINKIDQATMTNQEKKEGLIFKPA